MRFRINNYHYYWIAIWTLVLAYLFYADSIGSNVVMYQKNFARNQFHVSYFFPLGRTQVARDAQIITSEPVYVTAYAPRLYNRAELSFSFDSEPEGWSIGVQTAPGFSYALLPLTPAKDVTIEMPIHASITENNRLRFILAHDGMVESPLTIRDFSITLSEPRYSYSQTVKDTLGYLYERATAIF